ncbi:MAG: hypothetical protein JST85_11345 [Acidobacteria bacterium]|nr:hypothetical protein [Acidobacteriota bacterium]
MIDELWRQAEKGKQALLSKVFLVVAEPFLHTHHHTTEPKGNHAITIFNFHLPPTKPVLELRKAIWQGIFSLYQVQDLRAGVLKLLQSHRSFEYHSCDKQIVEQDAAEVLPFIVSELNPGSYSHCVLVQDYLDSLSRKKIAFDNSLEQRFKSETYRLAEILLDDWAERSELGWEQYQQQKRQQIKESFGAYGLEDYKRFFECCIEIQNAQTNRREMYAFPGQVIEVLLNLADNKPSLFVEVLEYYFGEGDLLNLADHYPSGNLIAKLIEICGANLTYQILTQSDYGLREKWVSVFFVCLPSELVTAEHISQLYSLYRTVELGQLPQGLDFLARYQVVDADVFIEITSILVEKAEIDSRYGFYLADLFNEHSETSAKVKELFARRVDLLKQAYFLSLKHDRFPDYKGNGFNAILDLDRDFACEYVEWVYDNKSRHDQMTLSHYDDERNYDFLWLRNDWIKVMGAIVWRIFDLEKERHSLGHSYTEVFFIRRADEQTGNDIMERQEQFISEQIRSHGENPEFMSSIFQVVANFSYDRRPPFFRLFLDRNKRLDDFKMLPLEPGAFSCTGSAVPVLQKKLEYFESLLTLFNSAEFLRHKQYLEQRIQGVQDWIEEEKKRDFMRD